MSQLDQVKENISHLKYWLGIVIATALAVASWLFDNVDKIEDWKIAVGSLTMAVLFISNRILYNIKKLGDL